MLLERVCLLCCGEEVLKLFGVWAVKERGAYERGEELRDGAFERRLAERESKKRRGKQSEGEARKKKGFLLSSGRSCWGKSFSARCRLLIRYASTFTSVILYCIF